MQSGIKVSCSSWVGFFSAEKLGWCAVESITNIDHSQPWLRWSGRDDSSTGTDARDTSCVFSSHILVSPSLFPSRMSKAEHVIVWIRLRYQDMALKTGGGQDMAGNGKIYGWIWYVLVIYMAGYGNIYGRIW